MMAQKIDIELAMKRLERTRQDALRDAAAVRSVTHDERGILVSHGRARVCDRLAEDIGLVLEALHQRGFAYDR